MFNLILFLWMGVCVDVCTSCCVAVTVTVTSNANIKSFFFTLLVCTSMSDYRNKEQVGLLTDRAIKHVGLLDTLDHKTCRTIDMSDHWTIDTSDHKTCRTI